MIVRMWHGRVPTAKAIAYREFLNRRAVPDYRAVPGNVSVRILERGDGEITHFTTLTMWDSLAAIRRFAGDDIERAKYYPEDETFLLEFEPTVVHYEVVGHEEANGNLESISPFFIVKDLQVSIAHYVERFGFQLAFQGPNDDLYYASVSRDGIAIMLKAIAPDVLPQPNHTRHGWARWDAYIYTKDPDALFEEFSRRGASFVKKLSFIDDGLWGFEVTDADGYVLAFFHLRNQPGASAAPRS